jgi:outer membrane protein OmpA-like peptidoglycan-associated protein
MGAARAKASEREQAAHAATEAAIARERVEQAQSETAKAKANEGQARDDADRARLQTEEAKRERDAAQQRLYFSLSEILETRREARGLIVNLSDVLFDTGQATLKPGAREKLSKLAGILSAYSGAYRIEIEGHTDSVGSDESNLNLSRGRAESVRDYLVQNGVKSERVIATSGFGEAKPVAGNETAAGRQINRRVEIIIADQFDKQAKAGNQ